MSLLEKNAKDRAEVSDTGQKEMIVIIVKKKDMQG
jgi:hypothetical protein